MDQSKNKVIAATVIIVAVVLIALAASAFNGSESNSASDTNTSTDTRTTATESSSTESTVRSSATSFNDGQYTVNDTYLSPGGQENIEVTLTLSDNTITEVSVAQDPISRDSEQYQEQFQDEYKSKVVGKSLAELNLSRVSGASLTTAAFNDALDQIRNQAQV